MKPMRPTAESIFKFIRSAPVDGVTRAELLSPHLWEKGASITDTVDRVLNAIADLVVSRRVAVERKRDGEPIYKVR